MGSTVFFESSSELAKLTNTFKVDSVATDPTTVSLIITTPAQVSTTYTYAASEITKTSTGVFTKSISCTEDGTWTYEWVGTGAASDNASGTWQVFPTHLGKLYATVEALKSRFADTVTTDDFEYHQACYAAARAVEQICQRVFYRTTSEARTFVADNLYCLKLGDFNDLVSVSAITTDDGGDGTFETTWLSTDYQLLPHNPGAAPEQRPYTEIKAVGSRTFPKPSGPLTRDDRVKVTGVWGWPSVPFAVKEASLILAADFFKLKDAPFGVAGFGEFGQIRVRENQRVMSLLGPYRKYAVLVG